MITLLRRWWPDTYMLAMVGTVVLAALLPARGAEKDVFDHIVHAAIATLFFIYGARITPQSIRAGITHWRLQGLVLATTFMVFPVIGLGMAALTTGHLDDALVTGLLFLSLLPSTVQSSIAFTSMARGNVPAALCCASLSNLTGVVITPLLAATFLGEAGDGTSLAAVADIALQILLPFLAGQAARPLVGGWLHRRRTVTMLVERGSILLVVYSAFSAGVVAGLWSKVTPQSLALVIVLDLAMLALVLVFTMSASRLLRFATEDEIATVFCGSKKSLASGLPMANIIFPASTVGLIVLPLMLFHQLQLMVCAALAGRYAAKSIDGRASVTVPA